MNCIDWISEQTAKYYNGREIVIWGAHKTSKEIEEKLLADYNLKTAFKIDKNIDLIDGDRVKEIETIAHKSNQYYVIIPLKRHKSVKKIINEYGYKKDLDYCWFFDGVIKETKDYYEDRYGNKIYGRRNNIDFEMMGFNSTVFLGEGIEIEDKLSICIGSNSNIYIGNNCKIGGGTLCVWDFADVKLEKECVLNGSSKVTVRNNSKLYMGEKNVWERFIISVHENAILIIGKKCTFGRDTIIWSAPYTRIIIGEDCMFSTDVVVHSNDGHAIFDIKTGETINASEEICKSRKVIIGNHVWVGRRCLILYNAEIGDGSIIGAGSLVKKKIPNNVIAVGTPARVTRKDVAWSREPVSTNILDCGEEYINLTNE